MKLRPHHLMCTQGYSGKGYNDDFIKNMDYITRALRCDKNILIELVFSTDDICSSCPNMLGANLCNTNNKVKSIDDKMVKYFNLEEKVYNYNEIVNFIKENITEEIMDDICGNCNWYSISSCKKSMCCK
ncbi:DUF1284 domain-containing protein [Romboutsia lituseburensis]|uniref:DUF1284 domain-containing protein n=1 Tax=Romboutsia lituseburensis DSM 797 TaxID=1121325 RepID=A0A1G9J417_9FIRM|nr:DUF1284 domain-containing protein [Romboutsia lituseburensis]CEH33644.1 Protein of unknown function (DUF1284) [Romboutsia lituseburensis]SDL32062.1 hypothetical protein SAMN04515677_101494 [Romboutsia lituseburensis DSM 797]